jgi:hypothetical protein
MLDIILRILVASPLQATRYQHLAFPNCYRGTAQVNNNKFGSAKSDPFHHAQIRKDRKLAHLIIPPHRI